MEQLGANYPQFIIEAVTCRLMTKNDRNESFVEIHHFFIGRFESIGTLPRLPKYS
jgi:hypothetical protein